MSSIADQLKNMSSHQIAQLKTSSGKTLEQILRGEADRLKDMIQRYISEYYDSYQPSWYHRTGNFSRSFNVDDVVEIDVVNNEMRIYLLFNNDLAYHPSIFGGNPGYVPLLLNYGFQWENDTIHREHLSYYGGFHFVEKGISDFKQDNPYHLKIKVINNY